MKKCSTCSRTYEDDTLVFCLDDGSRLSAAYDPHATVRGPVVPRSDSPKTEILPPGLTPPTQASAPLRSTVTAVAPVAYPQAPQKNALNEKRGGTLWIILGGIVALLVVGLVSVLGYLAWKANNKSVAEPSVSSSNPPINSNLPEQSGSNSNAPTNRNLPANANRAIESKLFDDSVSLSWLDGVWTGEGFQSDTKTTWAVILTVHDGKYAIEYPNIPCQGRWTLNNKNSRGASFTELITQGANRCSNNGHIVIEKVNDSEISCKYSRAGSRVVIATAVLSKKAQKG